MKISKKLQGQQRMRTQPMSLAIAVVLHLVILTTRKFEKKKKKGCIWNGWYH